MPVGTVRGRYELDAPALRTLKDLEQQGIRTQAQMKRVADEMDRMGGQQDATRLREFNQAQAEVRRGSERLGRTMRDEWIATTRVMRVEVRKQVRELATLEAALDRIGSRNAQARVSVRGAGPSTLAKLGALDTALDRVDRGRVGSSFGGVPKRPVTQSMSGGGRGGRIGSGVLDFGMSGIKPRNLLLGGAAAYARPLIGGAGALAGSAAYGLAGAGALGLTGGLGAAVGLGAGLAVGKQTANQIGEAHKALQAYTEQVALYGRASNQARTAHLKLNQAMAVAPRGTRQLLRESSQFGTLFRSRTAPGRDALIGGAVAGVRAGERFIRGGGGTALNRANVASGREGGRFAGFLGGRFGQRTARMGAGIYDENLGNARQTMQYGLESAANVVRAARPMFLEMTTAARNWVRGWAVGTRDVTTTRRRVREMVDNLKSWWRLTRSAGGLLGSIFGAGQGQGQRMVTQLTLQLREWTAWIRSNPRQVREFFRSSVSSTIDLAKGLWSVGKALNSIAKSLGPVLDRFSQLTSLAGSAGLLTPGAGALAYGFLRGRGMLGGRGGRGGAAGGAGGATGGGGFIGAFGAGGGARGAARGIVGAPGYIRGTYGLARGFGYGRTASAAAGVGGALSGVGRVGLAGLRGAGKAFWPVAAGMGILDFASFHGNIAGRTQNALSGATLGIVPRPLSTEQIQDRGIQQARRYLGGVGVGTGLQEQRGAISGIQARIAANARRAGATRALRAGGARGGLVAGGGTEHVLSDRERRELAAQNKELRAALADRVRLYRQYRVARNRELDQASRAKAQGFFDEFQQGFRRRSKRSGPEAAMAATVSGVVGQIRKMRTAGGRELAQTTLDWARRQARNNPKLKKQYDDLVKGVVRSFKGMHGQIRVIDGQILTGSKGEWKRIADTISSQARRGVDETSNEYKRLNRIAIGSLMESGYTRQQSRLILQGRRAGSGGESRARGVVGSQRYYEGNQPGQGDGWGSRMSVRRPRTGDGPGAKSRQAAASAGSLMGASPSLGGYAAEGARFGLRVSSGRRPGALTSAGNVSYHSSGNAIDMAGSPSAMRQFALYMARTYGSQLEELIYSPLGWSIKNGRRTAPYAVAEHYDHVHVADTSPGGRGGVVGGPGGGGSPRLVHGRRSRLGGVQGALSTAASRAMARGINARLRAAGGAPGPGGGGGGGVRSAGGQFNRGQLAALWRQAGGDPRVARLMGAIALAESGGNPTAHNPSGATGLWQILGNPFPGNARDPFTNARMAVSKYNSQGLGAWEAYTNGNYRRYQGDGPGRSPGRRGAGSRPRARMSFGGGGAGVNVSFAGAVFHVRGRSDAEAVAELVGKKILAVLERDDGGEGGLGG